MIACYHYFVKLGSVKKLRRTRLNKEFTLKGGSFYYSYLYYVEIKVILVEGVSCRSVIVLFDSFQGCTHLNRNQDLIHLFSGFLLQ